MDSKSIEEMYVKYYTALKRYCIKLVSYNSRYSDIAEDCVQEAFYRAVCNAEDFESSPNQYGWLATCCSHYMLSHIRQSKKREAIIGKTVSLEAYGDVPDLMDNILAWIAHTEYQETVEEFMAEFYWTMYFELVQALCVVKEVVNNEGSKKSQYYTDTGVDRIWKHIAKRSRMPA